MSGTARRTGVDHLPTNQDPVLEMRSDPVLEIRSDPFLNEVESGPVFFSIHQ